VKARRLSLVVFLLCMCLAPPAAAERYDDPGGRASGWASSSSPSFDYRQNGSALPFYLGFLAAAGILVLGLRRLARRLGGLTVAEPRSEDFPGGDPPRLGAERAGRVRRFLLHGLLQARTLAPPVSSPAHLLFFWGFLVLLAGSILLMADAYLVAPVLGRPLPRNLGYRVFQGTLDAFGILLLAGVVLALVRRLARARDPGREERRGLGLLLALLYLGLSGFLLEGLRMRAEGGAPEPWAFAGSAVAALLHGVPLAEATAMTAYRILWWGHAGAALALVAAIPFTFLRHLVTSPLGVLASSSRPDGTLRAPFRLETLLETGRFDVRVGASRMEDFDRGERLAWSACADHGACHEVCPAHATGTALSPMRIMRHLRAAWERDGRAEAGEVAGAIVSEDEIWSCTLCGACSSACPVLAEPWSSIVELRRGIAASNRLGRERTEMLDRLSRTGNPYGSPASAREGLARELGVPTVAENPGAELVYWIGCAATCDPRARRVAEAMAAILRRAGIPFAVLGPEERCTGDPARRVGEEGRFQELVLGNLETFRRRGVKKVLTHCAHCLHTLGDEYPELGGEIEVVHHVAFLRDLLREGRIRPERPVDLRATIHDSCILARFTREVEAPREALARLPGLRMAEMPRSGARTFCCGGGGGGYWYEVPRKETMGRARTREAAATGAEILVTECPFCLKMLDEAARGGEAPAGDRGGLEVLDVAELVARSLEGGKGEDGT
jgi:Fe-S oxidoreductase/nitrate reductase gamma subunit